MSARAHVPCNGCTLCCENELLVLHPELGDDPEQYETQEVINPITGAAVHALKHKPEGGCVYLGEGGCTIHDRAPAICRAFDCRKLFQRMSRAERRMAIKNGWATKEVFKAGRDRLGSLR